MWRSLSLLLLVPLVLLTPAAAPEPAAACAAGSLGCVAADDEPVIQDKKLSEWIEMLRGEQAKADRGAALGALGSAAAHPAAWKFQVVRRSAGVLAVSLVASQHSPKVFPALLDALQNDPEESVRRGAALALGRLGAKVHDDNDKLARKINLTEVRDGLGGGLRRDKAPKVREACAKALGQLQEDSTRTVPDLAAALKDPDAATQATAADAVRQFGKSIPARDALPQLEAALKDPKTNTLARVRLAIAVGIIRRQPATPADTEALLTVLNEESAPEELRIAVVESLGALGNSNAVESLTKVLGAEKSSLELRRACLAALDNFGPAARPALPQLRKGLRDKDKFIRTLSMHVIGRLGRELGPEGKEVVKELLKITSDPVYEVRVAAIETLGNLGADALGDELPDVLKRLAELSKDGQKGVREAAEDARKKLKQTP